jgi:hypothetical protein
MSRDRYLLRREPDGAPSRNRFTASSTLSSVADPDPGSDAFVNPGFGIRCPGWVKKSGSGSEIRFRDEQPGSYFRERRNNFFGLKYLNSLMWIQDGKNSDPQH